MGKGIRLKAQGSCYRGGGTGPSSLVVTAVAG